jgi:hypothetical protein
VGVKESGWLQKVEEGERRNGDPSGRRGKRECRRQLDSHGGLTGWTGRRVAGVAASSDVSSGLHRDRTALEEAIGVQRQVEVSVRGGDATRKSKNAASG